MKKLFTLFLLGCAAATANAQQIPNGGFDQEWVDCIPWDSKGNTSVQGEQPTGWIISNVCGISGTGATIVGEKVENGQGNAEPNYSVKITNTANPFMRSQIIPAYISLGTTWATAVSNIAAVNNADGGVYGGKEFTYKPDAIKLYYTRSHGTANTTEKASVIAYLWKGTYTQKDVPGNTSLFQSATTVDMIDRERNILNMSTAEGGDVTSTDDAECIAKLEYYIEGNQSEWKELVIPFEYTSNNTPEKLNVIIAANDYFADRSTIGAGNTLCVDNVSLIYYSQLASLSYDGTAVANFNKDTYSYNIDAAYDESKLEATADGVAATIEKAYNEETGVLTITVKGDDWSEENKNEHVYTIQFKTVTEYTNRLLVGLDAAGNISYTPPTEQTIQLIKELDGSYSFFLADFSFGALPVGDIKMTNLKRTEDGNKVIYEQTQDLSLMEGNLDVTATLHAEEEDGQMTANIDIPDAMNGAMDVYVTFAPALAVNSETNIADDLSGLYNVTMTRSFPAGWSTICLPFETTVTALGATQAQAFTAFADNVLTFDKVNDGNLKANTPYLIYFEKAKATPAYMPANIESIMPESVTFGNVTFTGNYTAGMSMVGLYGVAEQNGAQYIMKGGAGSKLGSTGAYFTVSGTTAGVNTLSLDIEGEGTTGIESIVAEEGQAFDVYTLTGVKVRTAATDLDGLQRGIYIVNGKKVLVK